jgi:proline dehydrogenase
MMRSLLLAMSENRWLRDHATRAPFVRRAVRRFMPGEDLADMLAAAATLEPAGIGCVYTRLGESIADEAEARAVREHYVAAIQQVADGGRACEPSVKPTQLGLDLGLDACHGHLRAIAASARAAGVTLWVDMEQSRYADSTLELARRLRAEFPDVGVCLQAYLRRTAADAAAMADLGVGVRLVKGAYREPEDLAFPRRADVDANFLALARSLLARQARGGFRAVFGTHDLRLIEAIREHACTIPGRPAVEVHMLYGIQRAAHARLQADGVRLRVLIAYGRHWFPWYMRRLAERPANAWFVARQLFG